MEAKKQGNWWKRKPIKTSKRAHQEEFRWIQQVSGSWEKAINRKGYFESVYRSWANKVGKTNRRTEVYELRRKVFGWVVERWKECDPYFVRTSKIQKRFELISFIDYFISTIGKNSFG